MASSGLIVANHLTSLRKKTKRKTNTNVSPQNKNFTNMCEILNSIKKRYSLILNSVMNVLLAAEYFSMFSTIQASFKVYVRFKIPSQFQNACTSELTICTKFKFHFL